MRVSLLGAHLDAGEGIGVLGSLVLEREVAGLSKSTSMITRSDGASRPLDELLALVTAAVATDELHQRTGKRP